jgi:hypothetical protein
MWAMKADFSPLVDPADAQALNNFSKIQTAEILYSHLHQSKFFSFVTFAAASNSALSDGSCNLAWIT